MKLYSYDNSTGLHLGELDAEPDQMGTGFLVPAFTTPIEPPAEEGNHRAFFVRDHNAWELREVTPYIADGQAASAESDLQANVAFLRRAAGLFADSIAQAQGFDSMDEAVTYADEPAVPVYQVIAQALRAWRSLYWFDFERYERAYLSEAEPLPADVPALLELLPKFTAPEITS